MSVSMCEKCGRFEDTDYVCEGEYTTDNKYVCSVCLEECDTPNDNRIINGETFAQFVARMEAQPGEEP